MNDAEFIGNCSTIDWGEVIETIKNKPGIDSHKYLPKVSEVDEMKKMLKDYLPSSIEWLNYYPGKDFDNSVVEQFGKFVGYSKVAKCWISRINPGKTAPWHWDYDTELEEYKRQGELIRFTAKVSPADFGQVSIIGNTCWHNQKPGDTLQWKSYDAYHAGTNCGLVPKYQFNYLAVK